MGSFYGYRKALKDEPNIEVSKPSVEKAAGHADRKVRYRSLKSPSSAASASTSVRPTVLAARALGVGSLLSVGSVSLLVLGFGYCFGCETRDDYVAVLNGAGERTRGWLETACGVERSKEVEEDERRVKNMTKEEEEAWAWRKIRGEE